MDDAYSKDLIYHWKPQSATASPDRGASGPGPLRRELYFQELFSLNVSYYIVAHDFGRDLGCYGRPVETPNIDRLAGESFRFTHAHTSAVCCSPSRACAMSGLYPHRNGVMGLSHLGWPMPAATRTLVDWLNEAGVETAHCGFQHERDEPTQNRYAVEFTETREDHLVQNAVDQAITYLKSGRNTNKPFYLNVGTLEAHSSAWKPSPDPPAAERFKLRQYERYEPYVDGLEPVAGDGHAYPRRYRAALRFFDHHVGRLLNAVDQLGLKESTADRVDHGSRCRIRFTTEKHALHRRYRNSPVDPSARGVGPTAVRCGPHAQRGPGADGGRSHGRPRPRTAWTGEASGRG